MKQLQNIFHALSLTLLLAIVCTATARAQVVYDDSIKILYPKADSVITILNAENGKVETDFSLSSEKVLKLNKVAAKDSTRLIKDWSKWRPKPKKALWLAIALPGAGQI